METFLILNFFSLNLPMFDIFRILGIRFNVSQNFFLRCVRLYSNFLIQISQRNQIFAKNKNCHESINIEIDFLVYIQKTNSAMTDQLQNFC